MTPAVRAALVAAALLVPSVAAACLWDYDTLQQERSRFPTALELITGKFLRHSPEFYEWRVRDRHAKLAADPSNLALLDDLAVAYHKTGRNDQAIETVLAAERLQPGRYETASNHGTLLMLAGRWQEGVLHIDRALAINPDAHFGREKYQKALANYVLARRPDGVLTLPLMRVNVSTWPRTEGGTGETVTISDTFASSIPLDRTQKSAVRPAALKGVLGMMRFADHASPLLLEALGGLLSSAGAEEFREPSADAKQLAARAYLKASYGVTDPAAKEAYRKAAAGVLEMQRIAETQHGVTLAEVETEFTAELAEADAWYKQLRQDELSWIRDGKDADAEFARLYQAEPYIEPFAPPDPPELTELPAWLVAMRSVPAPLVVIAVVALTPVCVIGLAVARRRRSRAAA